MGQNSKTIEAFYAAMGRGDIPFIMGTLDPQIVWNEAENFVYADHSPYVGVDKCSAAFLPAWRANGMVSQPFRTRSSTAAKPWSPWGATAGFSKPPERR